MSDQEPRDLTVIIDRMLEVIPEESATAPLRTDLGKAKNSALYTAPELMKQNWVEVVEALRGYFGDRYPTEEWEKKITAIFTDKE